MDNSEAGGVDLTVTPISEAESAAARDDQASGIASAPILVAVDMSADSRAALLWAGTYAAQSGAPLSVLHVLHDPADAPGKYSRNSADPLTPMADTAEKMLATFLAEVCADHPEMKCLTEAGAKVMPGLPAGTIVEEAVRSNVSLIVIGSRGQTGLSRLLNGSTAQRVAQLSPIPVTIVKANGR